MSEILTRAGGAPVPSPTLVQADQDTIRGDGSHGAELRAGNVFQNFVFRPGGPSARNVYNDFLLLEQDARKYQGYKTIQFDDTFVTPVVVPPRPGGGDWDFGPNAELTAHPPARGLEPGNIPMRVTLADGATFTNLVQFGGYMLLVSLNTRKAPIVVSPHRIELIVVGSGPQNNYPQLVNNGTVPFIDLTAPGATALIRLQGAINGSHPAIDLGNNVGPLGLTTYDSAQIRANMIVGTNPAARVFHFDFGNSCVFGQQPNFAGTIGNGSPATVFQQGANPTTRDWIVPDSVNSAPIVPLTASTVLGTGALAIYDATAGNIAQTLPRIRNPAPATGGSNQTDGTNFVGGQTLKIKNVGTNSIVVSPDTGDTIDYGAGPVSVGPGGCIVFEADGINNWLIVGRA